MGDRPHRELLTPELIDLSERLRTSRADLGVGADVAFAKDEIADRQRVQLGRRREFLDVTIQRNSGTQAAS